MAEHFDYVAFLLFLLYMVLFGVGVQQLYTTLQSRNKRLTIRNGIVCILTAACSLRIIFWLKTCIPTTISDTLGLVLFFLPLWMNFAGLSLLVVFYAQAVSPAPSKGPMYTCIVANSLLFLANLIIAGELDSQTVSTEVRKNLAVVYAVYGSLLDFSLAILLGWYGHRFKTASSRSVLTTRIMPNSLSMFAAVNRIIIITYVLRGSFTAIIASHKVLPAGEGDVEFNGTHPVTSATIFFFFLVCEITPCACVFGMLWRVSSSGHQMMQKRHDTAGRPHDSSHSLDTRLLSVEDAKVKIFLAANGDDSLDRHTASLEDLEDGPHGYLFFEDQVYSPEQHQEQQHQQQQQPYNYAPSTPPRPIPTYPPGKGSLIPFPMPPSSTSATATSTTTVTKSSPNFWASKLSPFGREPTPDLSKSPNFWAKSFGSIPTSTSREATPDLTTYIYEGESATDGAAIIRAPVGDAAERYGNTVSPRDILLQSERRRSAKGQPSLPNT